ncbi:myb-like protein X isoform X2 [Leptidea sinapis]|uniref:myb-like protein X isoform X2 n=1 Tax=Leptidea sinapis TaxID=189913 RepID=UPI00213E4646|nr:myb-like protein X isoform X2 [Leptidea sinapis]
MSQIITRKGPVGEDKEKDKKHADSPAKETKKKMAAQAEKEKQVNEKEKSTEKSNSSDKTNKSNQNDKEIVVDKSGEKKDKAIEKSADKKENTAEKPVDKKEKATEKPVDKKEKATEKPVDKKEKATEKAEAKKDKVPETGVEKKVEKVVEKKQQPVEKTVEKAAEKKDKGEKKEAHVPPMERAKDEAKENGKGETSDTPKPSNKPAQNGTRVNGDCEVTVSSEDEEFPELAYEDSDIECFEPSTPDGLPSRSYTRRSQSKETKLLKLKEDPPSDRKLRSSDSPKPQDRKEKNDSQRPEDNKSEQDRDEAGTGKVVEKPSLEIIVDVEMEEERSKPDTNYSKSRVKVSPYRRSARLLDQTTSSVMADYTGNNTTMEMDITESSVISEEPTESPFLSGLRIRGRRSYRPLKEMTLRNIGVNTSIRSTASLNASEPSARPTGTVVGRKRKPESNEVEIAEDAPEGRGKRSRLLERLGGLTRTFRSTGAAPTPVCDINAQIVGINTDLPLPQPVVVDESVRSTQEVGRDPEPRDKRCVVM